jgi:hypothetical protein
MFHCTTKVSSYRLDDQAPPNCGASRLSCRFECEFSERPESALFPNHWLSAISRKRTRLVRFPKNPRNSFEQHDNASTLLLQYANLEHYSATWARPCEYHSGLLGSAEGCADLFNACLGRPSLLGHVPQSLIWAIMFAY